MTDFWQTLQQMDQFLFFFINGRLHFPFLDWAMVFITEKENWYIPLAILWGVLIWKGGRRGRILALLLPIAVGTSDAISSHLLKPWVGRFRPCKTLEGFRLLVSCGGIYSFPSSHATNIATLAGLFAMFYPASRWFWIVVAFLVGTSRIYVGVHYPADVAAGYLLGITVAFVYYKGSMRIFPLNEQKFSR